jgi:hypothetical protein
MEQVLTGSGHTVSCRHVPVSHPTVLQQQTYLGVMAGWFLGVEARFASDLGRSRRLGDTATSSSSRLRSAIWRPSHTERRIETQIHVLTHTHTFTLTPQFHMSRQH